MYKYVAEDVGGEVGEIEEDAAKEGVKEVRAQMKMGLTSQMSPVPLKIQSDTHSKTRQEK